MALNARSKGQVGEREVADMLNAIIFTTTGTYGDFKRNLSQTQSGGYDLESATYPQFAIEVKRVETLAIEAWWAQAKRQANAKQLPILIWRQSRKPWHIRTYGSVAWSKTHCVVDISLEAFRAWFAEQIGFIYEARG